MTRQRSEHDAVNDLLERTAEAARDANGADFLRDADDLIPARPVIWMLLGWLFVVAALAMILTGCGGGIDTVDEFMGPPEQSGMVKPPRPCPVNVTACHPEPTPG